jgi:hypothetical protein
MDESSRYWFSAKRFGLGWRTPLTWQGWAVDLGFLALIVATSPWFRGGSHPLLQIGSVFCLLALLVTIRHFKGEP